MTLYELTNHEAGIIVYGGDNENSVAVYNWASCADNRIPITGPFGIVLSWPEEDDVFDGIETERFTDVRTLLPGSIWMTDETDNECRICDTDMDIVSDHFGDLIRLVCDDTLDESEYEGTAYKLRDGRVILVLDCWN